MGAGGWDELITGVLFLDSEWSVCRSGSAAWL